MTPVERTYASRRATLVVTAARACNVEGERERRSGRRWRIGARAMAGTVMLLAVSSAIAGCGDDHGSVGSNPDVLIGGPGDDTIDSRDGKPEVVVCGSGVDTVVADEFDEISVSCEHVTFRLGAGAENTGSTLLVDIDNTNGGGGRVKVAIDHPFKLLPPCQALECEYQDLPATATMLIAPDGDIGTVPEFGGDCAGVVIAPCRLTMDRDHVVNITFNGSG